MTVPSEGLAWCGRIPRTGLQVQILISQSHSRSGRLAYGILAEHKAESLDAQCGRLTIRTGFAKQCSSDWDESGQDKDHTNQHPVVQVPEE